MIDNTNVKGVMADLNDYFVQKILNGEFTLTDTTLYYATIEVDGFTFKFWIGSDYQYLRLTDGSAMNLDFPDSMKELLFKKFKMVDLQKQKECLLDQRRMIDERLAQLSN